MGGPRNRKPLRNKFADNLRAIVEGRGLTQKEAAKQLGISAKTLNNYLIGANYPGYEVSKRISKWALENTTYERARKIRTNGYKWAGVDGTKWRQLHLKLPEYIFRRVSAVSNTLNITEGTFIQVAIEHMLDNAAAAKTLDQAARKVYHARLKQAVAEAPGILDILKCEVNWAIKMGLKKPVPIEEVNRSPFPMERVKELSFTTDGAWKEDIWDTERDPDWAENLLNSEDDEASGDE